MDIKELLDQFTLFDPAKGQRAELPAVEGNYIVVLKAGCNIPDVLGNFKYTEISLHGVDYRVLYTGIASDLKRRIWTNHLHGNGGNSTLRKTLGSLFGYQKIPRDKNYQINKKTKFGGSVARVRGCPCRRSPEQHHQTVHEKGEVLHSS